MQFGFRHCHNFFSEDRLTKNSTVPFSPRSDEAMPRIY